MSIELNEMNIFRPLSSCPCSSIILKFIRIMCEQKTRARARSHSLSSSSINSFIKLENVLDLARHLNFDDVDGDDDGDDNTLYVPFSFSLSLSDIDPIVFTVDMSRRPEISICFNFYARTERSKFNGLISFERFYQFVCNAR